MESYEKEKPCNYIVYRHAKIFMYRQCQNIFLSCQNKTKLMDLMWMQCEK